MSSDHQSSRVYTLGRDGRCRTNRLAGFITGFVVLLADPLGGVDGPATALRGSGMVASDHA